MNEYRGDGLSDLTAGLSVLNLDGNGKRRSPLLVDEEHGVVFRQYENEDDLEKIVPLISKDLSEPYSLYTYRYFIYNWPELCLLATREDGCVVGTIVCKLDYHGQVKRGYIAMLAVEKEHRRKRIGSTLVQLAVELMIGDEAQEVVLEAEVDNKPALALYEQLGFLRDKYLFRYYLTGTDAFRLKLWLDT
ncbi:n acetyltransferase mak3 [Echinococcus multilocularis]|uniref:N acetyltransferase mak3 n=1 Tax=Echinococcus multilocularis TaxID=6211 RepID=A0A068Y582_ECHMU|nr:n acetyltransferase mak3 [Echinococcus multilocularis]